MKFRSSKILLLLAGILMVTACSNQAVYTGESFSSDSPFKIKLDSDADLACESARRALLGQGYLIEHANSDEVKARKALTRDDKPNTFIEINVACLPETAGATLFATGLLSTYSLKKSTSSASVGVSALGSISLPIGQSADSLVKISEETIDDKGFYQRFFAAIGEIVDEMQAGKLASEPQVDAVEAVPLPLLDPASETGPVPGSVISTAPELPVAVNPPEPTPVMSEGAPPAATDINVNEETFTAPAETSVEAAPIEATSEITLQSILNEEMTRPVKAKEPAPGQNAPAMTLDSILRHDAPAIMPAIVPGPGAKKAPEIYPKPVNEEETSVTAEDPVLTPSLETEVPGPAPAQSSPVDDSDWHYDD